MQKEADKEIEILLIDDDEDDVFFIETSFQRKIKNNILIARDGQEGIDILIKKKGEGCLPDIILLDINMPIMNGFEFLQIVKQDPEFKMIPIIVLTSSSADEDVIKSYKLHANAFLRKPVSVVDFMEVIETFSEFWIKLVRLPSMCGRI